MYPHRPLLRQKIMPGIGVLAKLKQVAKLVWESHAQPMKGQPAMPLQPSAHELGVMFLGHSSFLIQIGGRNVLVDPVFATRLIVMRRQRRAGVRIADLPPIDAVLVTHAHMDHLNRPTLRKIARTTRKLTGQAPVVICPHGVEDLVDRLGFREVRPLERWQQTHLGGLTITFTPAKHWGARMFSDTHRGFGGYGIAGAGHSVYHSGDTAYFAGFHEIGERLQPDVALLPIGAYSPDSYRAVHTSPEEALQIFLELGASTMIPMHFGTFRLGREPMAEPPVRLMAEAIRQGVEEHVRILAEGETLLLDGQHRGDVLAGAASNRA
jgi:L-ascorbate metabolism protein UlaG (beta-lactamase superfamily)